MRALWRIKVRRPIGRMLILCQRSTLKTEFTDLNFFQKFSGNLLHKSERPFRQNRFFSDDASRIYSNGFLKQPVSTF